MGWGDTSKSTWSAEKKGEDGKKGRVRAVGGEKNVKRCFPSFNQQQPTNRYQQKDKFIERRVINETDSASNNITHTHICTHVGMWFVTLEAKGRRGWMKSLKHQITRPHLPCAAP